jgi:ABC-type branched-subunit amino acid transport system ATPase component
MTAAQATTEPLLTVHNLVKSFGGVRAVDGLSFEVLPGQTVSIIGPNGSGKTTAFNLISGILRPDSGTIAVGGVRIDGRRPEIIAELGLARTFQNGRVFGNMSVRDNVLVGMHSRLHASRPLARWRYWPVLHWLPLIAEAVMAIVRPPAVRREEAAFEAETEELLGLFGERLLPRQQQPAYSLSYANRRRTEIARALALRPRLLLLDEPTAGMNPTETAEVLEQLRALRAAGHTLLLIEHKLELVMALSDHVLVMDGGKLIAAGPPAVVQADEQVIEAYLGRGYAARGRTPASSELAQAPGEPEPALHIQSEPA